MAHIFGQRSLTRVRTAMDTFEQIWESSRTNRFSWAYPAVIWGGFAILIVLSLLRQRVLRRCAKLVAIFGLTAIAIEGAGREISEKWRLRREWAGANASQMTPEGENALTVDGANLTLGPLIYGFQAFIVLCVAALVISLIRSAINSRLPSTKPGHTVATEAAVDVKLADQVTEK